MAQLVIRRGDVLIHVRDPHSLDAAIASLDGHRVYRRNLDAYDEVAKNIADTSSALTPLIAESSGKHSNSLRNTLYQDRFALLSATKKKVEFANTAASEIRHLSPEWSCELLLEVSVALRSESVAAPLGRLARSWAASRRACRRPTEGRFS